MILCQFIACMTGRRKIVEMLAMNSDIGQIEQRLSSVEANLRKFNKSWS